jgi:D-alanine-D-alanine ligase
MHIGITYDLRDAYLHEGYGEEETAEFDSVETIAAIESALRSLGHGTERIGHARELAARLVRGERWDLVFNIAEGMHGFGREALVPALLDAYAIPFTFSDPLALVVTLHKGVAKSVVRDTGIATADFVVVMEPADAERVALPFPLFAKPVAEGTSKGIGASSLVHSSAELRARCRVLLERYRQPVLIERFLPGREFTVGVMGNGSETRGIGALEVHLRDRERPQVYSYADKQNYEQAVDYRLGSDVVAREAVAVAVAAWNALGCRDAGRVDVRCDEHGRVNFIEANPLAGLHPRDSDLVILCRMVGIEYPELIGRIVESALARCKASPVQRSSRVAA